MKAVAPGVVAFDFNPRSHEGSDEFLHYKMSDFFEISIHAPTKGATGVLVMSAALVAVFQSTLPRRERRTRNMKESGPLQNFNPRSHEGSDLEGIFGACICEYFNPRSHEGSDNQRLRDIRTD